MRYATAIAACAAIFVLYVLVGGVLGWRHGGGFIPMALFFAAIVATWRALTKAPEPQTPRGRPMDSATPTPVLRPMGAGTPSPSVPAVGAGDAPGPVNQAASSGPPPALDPARGAEMPPEEYFEKALLECEGPKRSVGLWAQALVETGGVESAAKAAYIRDRSRQLYAQAIELKRLEQAKADELAARVAEARQFLASAGYVVTDAESSTGPQAMSAEQLIDLADQVRRSSNRRRGPSSA